MEWCSVKAQGQLYLYLLNATSNLVLIVLIFGIVYWLSLVSLGFQLWNSLRNPRSHAVRSSEKSVLSCVQATHEDICVKCVLDRDTQPVGCLNSDVYCEMCLHDNWEMSLRIKIVRGCIQKFQDCVGNEINNNKHSLRSNTNGCGGKTH
jgi:hypothetical protein